MGTLLPARSPREGRRQPTHPAPPVSMRQGSASQREVLPVGAGLGRRDQVDVQLGKGMRARRRAVGLGQGGDPQPFAAPAGDVDRRQRRDRDPAAQPMGARPQPMPAPVPPSSSLARCWRPSPREGRQPLLHDSDRSSPCQPGDDTGVVSPWSFRSALCRMTGRSARCRFGSCRGAQAAASATWALKSSRSARPNRPAWAAGRVGRQVGSTAR